MNVLFVTTRDIRSEATGGDVRVHNVYTELSDSHHVFPVFFCDDGTSPETGRPVPRPASDLAIPFAPRFLLELNDLRSEPWDAVYVADFNAGVYGLLLERVLDVPLIFDDHNVTYKLRWAKGNKTLSSLTYLIERQLCRSAELVVTTSKNDQQALSRWIRHDHMVVGNGFDSDRFSPDGSSRSFPEPTMLFFGNMRYEPNVEAVEAIASEIAPQLAEVDSDITVRLAGPDCTNIEDTVADCENVVVDGFVDDLPAYIRGADGVIVPLKTGSGTRLKIIESLACGTPVLSTAKGAEGWPEHWTNLSIRPIDEFPEQMTALKRSATDPMADREEILEYSWQRQVAPLAERIASLG